VFPESLDRRGGEGDVEPSGRLVLDFSSNGGNVVVGQIRDAVLLRLEDDEIPQPINRV
jgi:hypothetical protein